ncbi:MAG: bifunctional glutamate N-acetyltransferase/amino-acid acetyltransferase ArgJ [Chloroflexota bacterium]
MTDVVAIEGGVTAPDGFLAGAASAGLRSTPANDLALLVVADGAGSAAATFTTNRFRAAPVLVAEQALAEGAGRIRAVVVNAGCANAGTGPDGLADAQAVVAAVAERLGCDPGEVLPASTGLIGSRLDVAGIARTLPRLTLGSSREAGHAAARAIMTTDTRPKEAAVRVGRITVGGMAKGSGMIHPRMATMLAFLTTDADAPSALLRELLLDAVTRSFNQVTVDGDTSTNDAVMLLASGHVPLDAAALAAGIEAVCRSLAQQIAADGEGAQHRIDVTVSGARDHAEAREIARTIAGSMLVKSAVHGADPNWGRIVAAAGRSGAAVDAERLAVRIGTIEVYDGAPVTFDHATATAVLREPVVPLGLDLRLGDGFGEAWGCDLTAEYVVINSEYHT